MNQSNFSSFGTVLTTFRRRRGLTQQQLAEQLGVRRNTVGTWERGDFLPGSRGIVLELARHLHLDDQETRQLLEASLTALAPPFLVPLMRNPFFTGREEVLEVLHAALETTQIVALAQSYALHGLGGVGKTQLALEYAYRHVLEYRAVFWIRAETTEQIISSFGQIAEMLHLPECRDKNQEVLTTAVKRWLATHGQWLLIWDNLDDLALLDQFLPSTRSGALLLTTRLQVLSTFAQGIDLWPMEQEEALLFFLRRAKVLSSEATREHVQQFATRMPEAYAAALEVVTLLGGLPLALDQAGAYVEETQCHLSTYRDLFRTRRASLLPQRGASVRDHPESVSTTLMLSMAATVEQHPAVREFLQVCALLQPDTIPEELFRLGAAHFGNALEAVCRDDLEWNRVIALACSYSLLHREPEERTLSMHRLVQAVILDTMTESEQHILTKCLTEALNAVFPEIVGRIEYRLRKQGERLLPHALLCLQRVGATEESLVLASLMYKIAVGLHAAGRYVEAEPVFLQALHLQEQMLGLEHPIRATTLNELAMLYWQQGKFEQAERLFQRALHICENKLGTSHPRTAITLNDLANLLRGQGKYAEAEPLYHRALAIREETLGPDDPSTASSLGNLALLYKSQGRYAEAEPLSRRALAVHEHTLAPDTLNLSYPLINLATLCCELGKHAEAEPLLQRALLIRERVLGPKHPETAIPLNNLAVVSQALGKDAEAEVLFQRTVQIWEHTLGLHHPFVACSLEDWSELYMKQGKNAEAEVLLRRALAIREQSLGQLHPETAQTLHNLALAQKSLGNLKEARSLAERALSIREQALGDDHPKTVATRMLYAELVQAQRRFEEETPGLQTDLPTLSRTPLHTMNIVVRGKTRQVAYTRTVKMREVTFTCTICRQTVTQQHYPGGQIKYCSATCKAASVAQKQEQRVVKQREKRRSARESRLQARQRKDV